jgi:hypothetical protein
MSGCAAQGRHDAGALGGPAIGRFAAAADCLVVGALEYHLVSGIHARSDEAALMKFPNLKSRLLKACQSPKFTFAQNNADGGRNDVVHLYS